MMYRPATMDDAERLMRWRNDQETVKYFRSNKPVSLIEHKKWLAGRIERGDPTFIMFEDDHNPPVGTVQLTPMEHRDNGFEVSITVAPSMRAQKLGGAMLRKVCDDFGSSWLYAEIKYDNLASQKIFQTCGFEQIGSYGLWTQWRRLPIR